jgi:hypothetical protein
VINWKEFRRRPSQHMLGFIPIFAWREITRTLINIAYAPAQNRNENLRNTIPENFSFEP